jgi:hypothetical protein
MLCRFFYSHGHETGRMKRGKQIAASFLPLALADQCRPGFSANAFHLQENRGLCRIVYVMGLICIFFACFKSFE